MQINFQILAKYIKQSGILFYLLVLQIVSFSQNLKTYSGEYPGLWPDEKGSATYSYKEDENTGIRLKEGLFKFSMTERDKMQGSLVKNISGSYKNNLKNGPWIYTLTYNDYYRRITDDEKYYATGVITLKANYKNGKPDGIWSYSNNLKRRNKSVAFNKLYFSPFSDLSKISIMIGFKDGIVAGNLTAKTENKNVTGQFNENGKPVGNWKTIVGSADIEASYNNGYLIKMIKRDVATGEILSSFIADSSTKDMQKQLDLGNLSVDSLSSLGFDYAPGNFFTDEFPFILNYINDNNDFLYSKIQGDLYLRIEDNQAYDKGDRGGDYYFVRAIQYYNMADDYDYKQAMSRLEKKDYYVAEDYLSAVLNRRLSPKDRIYIENLRKDCLKKLGKE